jgi:phosphoserine phosphatase RsbU/P
MEARDQQPLTLENERLRRAVQELSLLNELAAAIGSSFDPREIINIIVDRAGRTVHAEQVTITLVNELSRANQGTVKRYLDPDADSELYHLSQSLLGYMLVHKKPYLSADPRSDGVLKRSELPASLRNLVAVPLLVQSRLTGVLIAFNKRGDGHFDAADQRVLAIMGAQSGQVLETARLLEREKDAIRLQEELRLAGRIQEGLLPQVPPELDGYDLAAASWPAEVVGGDYFDFVPLAERRLAICVGDVSGKGLPASLLMANLQATLRAQALRDGSCRECASWCNRLLFNATTPEKFVTLFYAVIDANTHRLAYCNAGHERPIILGRDGESRRLKTGGLVVGLIDEVQYADDSCALAPDDVLLIFSDGATDMEDAEGRPVGEDRLFELLREFRDLSAAQIVEQIAAAVRAHAGSTPALDDLTLLVAKRLA